MKSFSRTGVLILDGCHLDTKIEWYKVTGDGLYFRHPLFSLKALRFVASIGKKTKPEYLNAAKNQMMDV